MAIGYGRGWAYRVFGPPTTFFIDAQGVIRDIVMGPVTPDVRIKR